MVLFNFVRFWTILNKACKSEIVFTKYFYRAFSIYLSQAKKRQQFLEDTYGGSIKELEFLIQTFQFDDKKLSMSKFFGFIFSFFFIKSTYDFYGQKNLQIFSNYPNFPMSVHLHHIWFLDSYMMPY